MTTLYPRPDAVPGAHYGGIPEAVLHKALTDLAAADPILAQAIAQVGLPSARGRLPGFTTLLRVIVSQQLSTKAAATIYGRLTAKLKSEDPKPEAVRQLSIADLRSIGLSERKASYAHGLAEAVMNGTLDFDALSAMPVEDVITTISGLRGFGRWSAEMYALFSLGHTDVWPVDDLAIVVGLQRLKKLKERPNKKQMEKLGAPWRPYRGCVAIFLWHYYGAATLDEAAALAVKGDKKAPPKKPKTATKGKTAAKKKMPKKKKAAFLWRQHGKEALEKPTGKTKSATRKKSAIKTKATGKKTPAKKSAKEKPPQKRAVKTATSKSKAPAAKKSRTIKAPAHKSPAKKKAIARRSSAWVADPRLKGRRTQGRRMPAGGRRGPR